MICDGTTQSLLSFRDLDNMQISELMACTEKAARRPHSVLNELCGRRIGLLFARASTRTRVSFWRAAVDLGAEVVTVGLNELQMSTGETWLDTGAVLAQYLDALVVRTNGPIEEMRQLANGMPVTINAMSSCEHPTQALSDYAAILEQFGAAESIRLGYFGEGNNTAAALALLFSRVRGAALHFYMPKSFSLHPDVCARVAEYSKSCNGSVSFEHEIPRRPPCVDVVYTTRWRTMGVQHSNPNWIDEFRPFRVDAELFDEFAADGRSVFMHDLPAVRGEEVTSEVLDGPRSIALRQAHHKRTGAMAAMLWCLGVRSR